jgi:hypothetical protein
LVDKGANVLLIPLSLGGSSKIGEEVGTKTTGVEDVFWRFKAGSVASTFEDEGPVTTRLLIVS